MLLEAGNTHGYSSHTSVSSRLRYDIIKHDKLEEFYHFPQTDQQAYQQKSKKNKI